MAKEAICALLAILGHFFEAFSSIDLFFALASFHLASSAFPCFRPSRFSSPPALLLPTPVTLRGRRYLHRPSLRRLLSVARIVTPSTLPHAAMSAIRFCSSRATIFRPLRFPSLSLAVLPSLSTLPHLSTLAPSCVRPFQPSPLLPAPASPAPCAPGPFLRTRASENHRGE